MWMILLTVFKGRNMERLTTINDMGVAVYKQRYRCERCGEDFWRLPDLGNGSPTDRLAAYENMQERMEKRIKEIKAVSYYPHNFTGQMVEDFEWVLSLLN